MTLLRVAAGGCSRATKVIARTAARSIARRIVSTTQQPRSANTPPRTVLVVKRADDLRSDEPLRTLVPLLQRRGVRVVVEDSVHAALPLEGVDVLLPRHITGTTASDVSGGGGRVEDDTNDASARLGVPADAVDLVVTLGGDGTLVRTSALFPWHCPPVVPFALGSVGFLLPFDFADHRAVLDRVLSGSVPLLSRMRLQCRITQRQLLTSPHTLPPPADLQALNEITVHRGRSPHLAIIDCLVNGERLTDATADGLIVATPSGSTAYSLSAGGPIVHPAVQSILLTPICPRSLSFRPALLPTDATIGLRLGKLARDSADLTIDGHTTYSLSPGDQVDISVSPFPLYCVGPLGESWVRDINKTLNWNRGFTLRNTHSHYPVD